MVYTRNKIGQRLIFLPIPSQIGQGKPIHIPAGRVRYTNSGHSTGCTNIKLYINYCQSCGPILTEGEHELNMIYNSEALI